MFKIIDKDTGLIYEVNIEYNLGYPIGYVVKIKDEEHDIVNSATIEELIINNPNLFGKKIVNYIIE